MSQTLALVVTAMVLLLTAAIVVFMTQGGLSDTFTGSQEQTCISQVRAQCQYGGSGEITRPKACQDIQRSLTADMGEGESDVNIPKTGPITCS